MKRFLPGFSATVLIALVVACGGSGKSPTPTPLIVDATIIATVGSTTPSPIASPIADSEVVPPEDCRVEPRAVASLLAVATPAGVGTATVSSLAAESLPTGEPVDDATVTAITETVRGWVACANAGDDLRSYALVTDDFLRRSIAKFGSFAPEEIELMQASPEALIAKDQLAVIDVRAVRQLPDGRVGAIIWIDSRTHQLPENLALRFFVFADVGDNWLIDEIVEIAS